MVELYVCYEKHLGSDVPQWQRARPACAGVHTDYFQKEKVKATHAEKCCIFFLHVEHLKLYICEHREDSMKREKEV